MLVPRRFVAAIIHNQRRRILTSTSATVFVLSPSKVTTIGFIGKAPYYSGPLTHLKKIILQPFKIFNRHNKNVELATSSIDRALRYSGLDMSAEANRDEIELGFKEEQQQQAANQSKENASSSSQSIESLDEPGLLDELKESYMLARKESSNIWLNYANKSCYIYLYRGGGEPNKSLAAFDLDGTLIKPKSNKRIPRSATDWDLFSVWTKVKLQQCLRDSRARFVIFTNQNGIGLNIVPLDEVQKRIELVTKRLDVPCTVFMAVDKDGFRKPRTGMFQLFDKSFNDSLPIDTSCSFYCGDAIGYPSHSDADIKFAQQLGLPFLTPEKFLRGVKPKLVDT